ncbi:MAG: hypothetical protein BHW00_07700 [Clostridium sp. 26_22]|jgi:hypothetical protein|nr:MAG: hypothetical protein BHW00_07700 [Clostridium sp. 26_22]
MLETQEKVGDVRRTPFGALKRICEENSMSRVLGSDMLARFERVTNHKVQEKQQEKQTQKLIKNEKVPLFTEEDMSTILHKDMEASMGERG